MPRLPSIAFVLLLAGLAAGCTHGDGPDADGLPAGARADVAEWRGRLPCADCEGIDTRLALEHRGGERPYRLVEVYVSVDGSQSFEEAGEWSLDRDLLSLEAGTGGERRYGVVPGGLLQVRDPECRVFPGREHDLLRPAGRHP